MESPFNFFTHKLEYFLKFALSSNFFIHHKNYMMKNQLSIEQITESQRALAKWFLCEKCAKICNKAILATCGHIFCDGCLIHNEDRDVDNFCTTCKAPLSKQDLFSGHFLDNFLYNQFNCYCINRKEGCKWKGKVGEYYDHHINNCQFDKKETIILNDSDIIEIPIEKVEQTQKNWLNECSFKVLKTEDEINIAIENASNDYFTPNQLKNLHNEINGEIFETESKIVLPGERNNNDLYNSNAGMEEDEFEDINSPSHIEYYKDSFSDITKNINVKKEYSTVIIVAEKASYTEPFLYLFPFFLNKFVGCKCELTITKRDQSKDSIILFGLSQNKKVFANYIDCVQNEEFFNDKSTFIFEYDEKENTILLSSQKHDLIFRNILPDDYIPKKYFLYPFIISTSPKNEFELHIYN